MATIGELFEDSGEITTEWKIKNFSSLSQEIDECYYSPKFYFSGASWKIQICPNGETEHKTDGWIGLYILRVSTYPLATINFSVSIKTKTGEGHSKWDSSKTFQKKNHGWGTNKYLSKSKLLEMKTNLIPSDVLTIICTLKKVKSTVITGSLFNRYDEFSNYMKGVFDYAKHTDVTLKVNGEDIPAHRMILEQSPVFAAMLRHDMKENQTGEIRIEDIEKTTIDDILEYLYTGDIFKLTTENVFSIYAAAEKYDIKVVKKMCSQFVTSHLSEDWVCDVIKFGDLYKDEQIILHSKDYFKENGRKILNTEKWKTFAKENVDIALDLINSVFLPLLPEQ